MYYDDDPRSSEVGDKYEQFIAAYYATALGCRVIYQGHILGKADGGIDLIALTPNTTYLIQCKKWKTSSVLHEDCVNQLSGSATTFARKYPAAKNIKAVLIATCQFAEDAQFAAEANDITLKNLDFEEKYVNGQIILTNGRIMTHFYAPTQRPEHMCPTQDIAAYQQRVCSIIEELQYPKPSPKPESTDTLKPVPVITQPEKPAPIQPSSEPIFRDPEKPALPTPDPSPTLNERLFSFFEKFPSPSDPGLSGCLGYFLWELCVILIIALLTVSIGFVVVLVNSTDDPVPITTSPALTSTLRPTATPVRTSTPVPTATPAPTATLAPTATPIALDLPKNGAYYSHCLLGSINRNSEFTITTPLGHNYCIVLVSADDPSVKLCSIFVRPGETVTVEVPEQKVLVYYTAASISAPWYGYAQYFGSRGSWSTSDEVFDFSKYTWSIKLQRVTNGNWTTEQIDEWEVPFLN